mgnify:CR=1 FL=1
MHSGANNDEDSGSEQEEIIGAEPITDPNKSNNTNNTNNTKSNDKKKKKKNKSKKSDIDKKEQEKPQSAIAKLIFERKRLQEEEDARIKAIEEENARKEKEEQERLEELERIEKEKKENKRKAKHDKIQKKKNEGTYMTKSEKEREKINKIKLEQLKNISVIGGNSSQICIQTNLNISDNNNSNERQTNSNFEIETKSDKDVSEQIKFKCPVFTVLGHVDVGKTSLLDNLRQTTIQLKEVGGITQSISTTTLGIDTIIKRTSQINGLIPKDYKIPGLLLIDTPGHEVFSDLRKNGIQLADVAILIIDLTHGIEPQTIESINLLKNSNTNFVIGLNKIDRLYGFEYNDDVDKFLRIDELLEKQNPNVKNEFETKYSRIKTGIMELGLNCEFGWKNNSLSDTISIIPISATKGYGVPDLLDWIIKYSQNYLTSKIIYDPNNLECIGMELSYVEGFGLLMDCLMKNGSIEIGSVIKFKKNDSEQFEYARIKNILMYSTNKTKLTSVKKIEGSHGIKICADGLEKAAIGVQIMSVDQDEYEKYLKQINNSESEIDSVGLGMGTGIGIYANNVGSISALENLIKTSSEYECPNHEQIKISRTKIGSLTKKDLIKHFLANAEQNDSILWLKPINLCVLVFEVDVDEDARVYAKENSINIFEDQTIYRLFNKFKDYSNNVYFEQKQNARTQAFFPCVLKIIESNIFNKKNPLIFGVKVVEGNLHLGTPLATFTEGPTPNYIGKVVGIQIDKKDVQIAKTGSEVCIKIDNQINPTITYGRQFDHTNLLYSQLTRKSVDTLKEYFKKDLSSDDVKLLIKLKKIMGF